MRRRRLVPEFHDNLDRYNRKLKKSKASNGAVVITSEDYPRQSKEMKKHGGYIRKEGDKIVEDTYGKVEES